MSLRQQLIRSFIGVGSMRIFAIPVGLVASIILARTLRPEEFGQYTFAMALLPLLALPAAGGVPQLLIREVAGYAHVKQWSLYRGVVRSADLWVVTISLVLIALFMVVGPIGGWIPDKGKWALMGTIILLVPIQGLISVRNGTIKGLGFPAYAELPIQLIKPIIVLVAFSVLAAYNALSSTTAVWTQVFAGVLTFVIASFLFVKVRPRYSIVHQPTYENKKWALALFPFTLIVLVNTFNTQVGIVLLGILGTDEAVAAMRVGERGAQFVALPLAIVNMVISPHIVKTFCSGDMPRLQKLSRQSARVAFFIALPLAVTLILFGKPLIKLAFGYKYSVISYFPLLFLVIGQLFNVFCGSVGQLLSLSGHEKDTLSGQVFSLVVNVIACAVLIPLYGAAGAAAGVAIGITTWNILLGVLVFKRLKIRPTAI